MKSSVMKKLASSIIFLGLLAQPASAENQVISVDKNFSSPIVSLSGYNKVFIQELDLSEANIISPPWIEKEDFKWDVMPGNSAHLKKIFHEGVAAGLTENNGRYTVVDKLGMGVLFVDVEIISFMPYTEKENTEAMTKGVGEFHISVKLRDGKTYALIHIFEGTVAIGSDYQPNTDMARLESANELFHEWGKRLRRRLDGAN